MAPQLLRYNPEPFTTAMPVCSTTEGRYIHDLRSLYVDRYGQQKMSLPYNPSQAVRLSRQEADTSISEATFINFVNEASAKRLKSTSSSHKHDKQQLTKLLQFLPASSSGNKSNSYPYDPTKPRYLLSTSTSTVTSENSHYIEKGIGTLAHTLATLTSPSRRFGIITEVLSQHSTSSSGARTWSEGFNTLLEGILRDGEDLNVMLPYDVVRSHFHRLSFILDAVTTPRLVILEVDNPNNVFIEQISSSKGEVDIRFAGLRSYSQALFGDPLIASCFDNPSEGFKSGWNESGEDVIEDGDNAAVRMMLYRCYRALVEVVTEYYRPSYESRVRENAGRRKLTGILRELEGVVMEAAGKGDKGKSRRG